MLLGNILLALAWAALQGEFSLPTLVTGQVLGYLILLGLVRGGVLNTSPYIGRVHRVVGAGHADDPVRAVGLHPDRRHAAGTGDASEVAPVDPERREVGHRHVAEHVVAERVDHRDLGAQQAGHHRLVGALAAEPELEVTTLDRLAGRRRPRVRDEIDHRAADDRDSRLVCHS